MFTQDIEEKLKLKGTVHGISSDPPRVKGTFVNLKITPKAPLPGTISNN